MEDMNIYVSQFTEPIEILHLPKEELQNNRNSITYEDMLQLQILKQNAADHMKIGKFALVKKNYC
jgi:hypothetical protein